MANAYREYPIHTGITAIPPIFKDIPLPSKENIVNSFGVKAGALFELRVASNAPRLAAYQPGLEVPPLESINVDPLLNTWKDRFMKEQKLRQQLNFTSISEYLASIQGPNHLNYRRWTFLT